MSLNVTIITPFFFLMSSMVWMVAEWLTRPTIVRKVPGSTPVAFAKLLVIDTVLAAINGILLAISLPTEVVA